MYKISSPVESLFHAAITLFACQKTHSIHDLVLNYYDYNHIRTAQTYIQHFYGGVFLLSGAARWFKLSVPLVGTSLSEVAYNLLVAVGVYLRFNFSYDIDSTVTKACLAAWFLFFFVPAAAQWLQLVKSIMSFFIGVCSGVGEILRFVWKLSTYILSFAKTLTPVAD
jgi:hypothetical protein